MTDRLTALRRRYLSLGLGELTSVVVFGAVAGGLASPMLPPREEAALWFALTPLLAVLLQGGVYWLAARTWIGRAPMPPRFAGCYRVMRVADRALLTAALVGIVVWWPRAPAAALLVVLVWGFGVAEYVNYFVVRLSFPVRGWWAGVRRCRTPALVRDLRRASSGAR